MAVLPAHRFVSSPECLHPQDKLELQLYPVFGYERQIKYIKHKDMDSLYKENGKYHQAVNTDTPCHEHLLEHLLFSTHLPG